MAVFFCTGTDVGSASAPRMDWSWEKANENARTRPRQREEVLRSRGGVRFINFSFASSVHGRRYFKANGRLGPLFDGVADGGSKHKQKEERHSTPMKP